jgi:hypothetical protein
VGFTLFANWRLGNVFPVGGFPFAGKNVLNPRTWIGSLNEWLKSIAETVCFLINFRLAIIGYDLDLIRIREQVLADQIPDERWDGILVPAGEKLRWYPPTIVDFQFSS